MPDFEMQLKWKCDSSWIPFLKQFCPSNNYWLLKRGEEWRLSNGNYPQVGNENIASNCSHSLIFTAINGTNRLLSYDFNNGHYVDVFSKKNIDESYWIEKASHQAQTGILSQQFCIQDCKLVQDSPANGLQG